MIFQKRHLCSCQLANIQFSILVLDSDQEARQNDPSPKSTINIVDGVVDYFLFRVLRSSVQTPPLLLLDAVILKSIQPLPDVFWQENPHSSNSTHDGTYDNQEPVQYSLFLA
jgi:hypothetical protein